MKKILLIEDNENIRENTAEILELSNYKVLVAENGKTGIAKAIEHKPDLIICDIMMPELDGYGVLHAIQMNDAIKNTPFIFLTAKTERTDFRKGMELGADDYISKPFNATELLNAVNSRIKKIESLKLELAPGLEGVSSLLGKKQAEDALTGFTSERDINKFKRKQLIYSEGNHPVRLYYILKGKVRAYKCNEGGKEFVTELYGEGDFVGHVALLEGSAYKDSADALEYSELAVIPKEDFDDLLCKKPEVMRKFIQLLAKNVTAKEEQLLGLAYNSLRRKVADSLLFLQQKYQTIKDGPFSIDMTRENLASIAGTATESLIRTLGDFKNERLITMNNRIISVIDIEKLKRLVN